MLLVSREFPLLYSRSASRQNFTFTFAVILICWLTDLSPLPHDTYIHTYIHTNLYSAKIVKRIWGADQRYNTLILFVRRKTCRTRKSITRVCADNFGNMSSSCDRRWTLSFKLDLENAKTDQCIEYIGHRSFSSGHTDTQKHIGPSALLGPLKWSVTIRRSSGGRLPLWTLKAWQRLFWSSVYFFAF